MAQLGDLVEVTVTKIVDFGAFASFSEGSALIHFSKIQPRVGKGEVGNVLSVGQILKCQICEIKPDGKISLSMKFGRKNIRKQKLENAKMAGEQISQEDTSIKSVWKIITDIQHYMLKYLALPIPMKKGSCSFSKNGQLLTAQIDTTLHFEQFKKEVRRVFASDIYSHDTLSGYWIFKADVDLFLPNNLRRFSEDCSRMFVNLRSTPFLEISFYDISSSEDSDLIKNRIKNYYPQSEIIGDASSFFVLLLPYNTHSELDELKEEVGYAIQSIRNGLPDTTEDGKTIEYCATNFNFAMQAPDDGLDTFYATINAESMLDVEGIRFGSMRGQSFTVEYGDENIPFGQLSKIDFPTVEFKIFNESLNQIQKLISGDENIMVTPDMEDMTGEIEKINRLRDSFNKITEHPESLVNPMLSAYLFDASKATGISQKVIKDRIELIRETQLNANLNDSQVEAIAKAVEAPDFALIQGPPGTGKSTAIAELIWQLAQQDSSQRILITSEANLAVDNALDKLKSSEHNLVRPIRIAAGDKFSAEGLSYAMPELKKWAGVALTELERQDDEAAHETDEYKSFNPEEVVLSRWLQNIYRRAQERISDSDTRRLWFDLMHDCPQSWRKTVLENYLRHVNVIGATCSAITDTNYTASERRNKRSDSRFIRKYREAFALQQSDNKSLSFNVVIQDEASKATPAELSLPLTYGEKSVVIGDHRQLPPNLDKDDILFKLQMQRQIADKREDYERIVELENYVRRNFDILEKSHFERLFTQIDKSLKGTFDTQYRMHRDINDVIAKFYLQDNGLHCGVADEDRQHNISIPNFIEPNNHVIWIDTESPEVREGTSRANRGEVESIEWILNQFSRSDSFWEFIKECKSPDEKEIGIITFYGGQLKRLRPAVNNAEKRGLSIKLSSVDRFQGMERNIVIVSLVRSNCISENWDGRPDFGAYPKTGFRPQKDIGFAKSPNRLNVALSRAKHLLIIVGNAEHFNQYVNNNGEAIYRNVVDTIKANPNSKLIKIGSVLPILETRKKVTRVPMPRKRSVNLNTRDINVATDHNLRVIETWLTPNHEHVENPRFAVLELSTKAVKLLFSKIDEDDMKSAEFSFNNFERQASKTETGKGLDDQNVMDLSFFKGRVLPVIQNMKRIMRMNGIDVVYTVATAAYRTAKNRNEIVELIRNQAGINVRILSKKEESVATMFAYGITSKYRLEILQCAHSVMIDQGGGSTEVSVFNQGDLIGSYSINLGTTALRNILTKDLDPALPIVDALKKSDQMLKERMVAFFKNMGNAMNSSSETFCVSVGTAITSATGKKNNASQHDSVLSLESINEKIQTLTSKITDRFNTVADLIEWEERMTDDQLDRVLTMRMGLPMFVLLMDKFNIPCIHVCGTGLWYGIYLQQLYNIPE